jgi:hypothetical protein
VQSILDLLDQTLVVLWVGSVADLLSGCWSSVVALGDWVLRHITLSTRQGVVAGLISRRVESVGTGSTAGRGS